MIPFCIAKRVKNKLFCKLKRRACELNGWFSNLFYVKLFISNPKSCISSRCWAKCCFFQIEVYSRPNLARKFFNRDEDVVVKSFTHGKTFQIHRSAGSVCKFSMYVDRIIFSVDIISYHSAKKKVCQFSNFTALNFTF